VLERVRAGLLRFRPRDEYDWCAIGLTAIALVGALWVSVNVFDRLPHVEDELAFLFQARTLAEGDIVTREPAIPEAFAAPFIIVHEGDWFGKYPPGYPFVLAFGVRFGAPWLVNPLMGAASVALLYVVGRRLYSPGTGLLAAALLTSSPFFLLQSGSMMSHASSLVWVLLAVLLFDRACANRSLRASLNCGAALGMLFLARPLTGVGIGISFALWGLADLSRRRDRAALRLWLMAIAGFLTFVLLLLGYNEWTTGSPTRSAYELWWPYDKIGLGNGVSRDLDFTLQDAWWNTQDNLRDLDDFLFGWPRRLSLVPAILAVGFVAWRAQIALWRRARRQPVGTVSALGWDAFFVVTAVSLPVAYLLYWSAGQMYGPRYYYEAIGALALLSARSLLQIAGLLGTCLARGSTRIPPVRAHKAGLTAVLVAVSLLTIHSQTSFTPRQFDIFTDWYGINRNGLERVQAADLDNAVVFVERSQWTDYAPFFSENAPSLRSEVVYAVDRGPTQNRRVMRDFPSRSAWRYGNGQLVRLPIVNTLP